MGRPARPGRRGLKHQAIRRRQGQWPEGQRRSPTTHLTETEILVAVVGAAAALVGAASALGAEFFLRPWFERRPVAAVLRIEIASNRQHLIALGEHWKTHPGVIPTDTHSDRVVFDNLATAVGSLRTAELVPVVELYLQLGYMERLVREYLQEWEISRDMKASGPRRKDAVERMNGTKIAFGDSARIALDRANTAFFRCSIAFQRSGWERQV